MPPKATPGAVRKPATGTPTPPPRRSAQQPVEQPGEDPEEQTGNQQMSKADMFDNATSASLGLPVGDWEARILEMVYEKNAKGESVKATYECTTADEESPAYGKKSSQWYQIITKEGNAGKGIGFLKKDLELLGVDEEGRKFANLEETLDQISTEQPLVNVRVKQNGEYTNVYIQGLVEDQG